MRKNRRRSRNFTGLTFYEDKNNTNTEKLLKILQWGAYTLMAVFLAVAAFHCFGFRVSVLGSSMEPDIIAQQNVLVNKLAYRMGTPERGDVIAFYPGGDEDIHPSVKRVVAIPGDSVQILNGVLLVNGVPCTLTDTYTNLSYAGLAEDLLMLEDDEYFVMGDNPDESQDSRSPGIGMVKDTDIIGEVWLVLPAKDTEE